MAPGTEVAVHAYLGARLLVSPRGQRHDDSFFRSRFPAGGRFRLWLRSLFPFCMDSIFGPVRDWRFVYYPPSPIGADLPRPTKGLNPVALATLCPAPPTIAATACRVDGGSLGGIARTLCN